MTRSIKQDISKRHLHGLHDSHPIGDRRADAVDSSPPPDQDALAWRHRKELPSWECYLAHLGDHVVHPNPEALDELSSGEADAEQRHPHGLHDAHPIGDRRVDADAEPPQPEQDSHRLRQELPSWEYYLVHPGGHAVQLNPEPVDEPAVLPSDRPAAHAAQRHPHGSHDPHPIGDRRADIVVNSPLEHDAPVQGQRKELPSWEYYLVHLGDHTVHPHPEPIISNESGAPSGDRHAHAEQGKQTGSSAHSDKAEARHHDSHPVGDRRTGIISHLSLLTLGKWSFYFIAKIGLYWMEYIAFHPLVNLVFAAFILLPVASRPWHRIKNAITGVLALTLLYYDSWLPPVSRVISQASNLSEFSFSYLVELLTRFISWPAVGALLAAWVVYLIFSYWLRAGVLVVTSMLLLGIAQSPVFNDFGPLFNGREPAAQSAKPDMDRVLQSFFDRESQRQVSFSSSSAVPFDVIFIHVCSLSWDDIAAVGLEQHPLWQRFDFLFKKFNSAASYSAPAAIHLLRATCGQQSHDRMYSPAPPNCYLMSSLQAAGYEPNLALNHTGKFDDFLSQVQMQGGLNIPMLSLDGLDVAQNAFNNSPIYDDLDVLNRWLKNRQKSAAPRVALYYNTVSLHDGNHLPGPRARPDTLETYRTRLVKFLDETEAFMQKLDESGRRAVVVMVPEHGAAVRGDKRQIAGLRDTPTPAITLVPVGIKVIGSNREGNALSINQPTSYMAISSLVARMLEKSPFTNNKFLPSDYVADLPITPFVAQTDKTTVAEYNQHYYLSNDSGGWENYAEFDTTAARK